MNLVVAAAAATLSLFCGGCAIGAEMEVPATADERAGLAGVRLGESRDAVLAGLAGRAAGEPRCTFSRLAAPTGRRAFPLGRCEHRIAVPAPRLAGRALERLVTYVVDDRLVRLDAAFGPAAGATGEDGAAATLRSRLDARLGKDGDGSGWAVGPDRLRLVGAPTVRGAVPGGSAFRLVAIDARVASYLDGLEDDLPPTGTTRASGRDGG